MRYFNFILIFILLLFPPKKDKIPTIDDTFKEADLSFQELDEVIKHSKSGKSPGPDGLTTDFYKNISNIFCLMHYKIVYIIMNYFQP